MMVGAAVVGLAGLALDMCQQAKPCTPTEESGAGVTIRTEMTDLWLPEELAELAKCPSQFQAIRTHNALRRFLESKHQEAMWYGLTARAQQVNGAVVDLRFIRRPYDDAGHFAELQKVVAAAGNCPPCRPAEDFAEASIHIMSLKNSKREPSQVMAELQSHPTTVWY
jgi:hypothetical protein